MGRELSSPTRAFRAVRAIGCGGRFEWGGSPSFLLELLEAGGVLDGEGALLPSLGC